MRTVDPVQEVLTQFRHEHLPPHLAHVSRLVGDVARNLAAGASELATLELLAAAHELASTLPAGSELALGLDLLADAAEGLHPDAEHVIRELARKAAEDVPAPSDPVLYARLRKLLGAKDALVRAEVSRPTFSDS